MSQKKLNMFLNEFEEVKDKKNFIVMIDIVSQVMKTSIEAKIENIKIENDYMSIQIPDVLDVNIDLQDVDMIEKEEFPTHNVWDLTFLKHKHIISFYI